MADENGKVDMLGTAIRDLTRKSESHNFERQAEGGATKGGVSKCEQTQTNADTNVDKHRGENAEAKTQANVSKRRQTLTPPFLAVSYTPFAIPLAFTRLESHNFGRTTVH